MDYEAFQNTVHSWFSTATGLTTVWASQSSPQPSYPFATLKMGEPKPISNSWVQTFTEVAVPASAGWGLSAWGTGGWGGAALGQDWLIAESSVPATITVECQAFVGVPSSRLPNVSAMALLGQAMDSLELDSIRCPLIRAGVSVWGKRYPQPLDALIADARISRAVAEVTFCAKLSTSEYVGYIETLQLISPLLGIDETVSVGG